ncbi:hypothetical protein [Actinomadura sp. 21ATH]|uniref:hypothetical protein n=1 Tax=Actinomadura sp. 21ATH TaxID=1735444 RepID=UPI0035BF5E63
MTYRPLPADQRKAGRSPILDAFQDDFRAAAANLAANVFDIMRLDELRAKTAASPYPRLRRLLDALGDAESIADGNGYRFRDPRTGRELRLADIP